MHITSSTRLTYREDYEAFCVFQILVGYGYQASNQHISFLHSMMICTL
jgi:hypothetical protein